MPNSWGRPPRNEVWRDFQALALWVVIIGIVGFLLFPNIFQDVYTNLSDPVAETSNLSEITLPENSINNLDTSLNYSLPEFPSVYNTLYNGKSEISSGYWVIFVSDGEFKQLSVTNEGYSFLVRLIENDTKAVVKNTLILAANGQIRKYVISDEIYNIITSMAIIDSRNRS